MIPTQLEEWKREFFDKFDNWLVDDNIEWDDQSKEQLWQFIESKLESVEEEVKQDLESNNIEVELDTEQCSEIALMVYEKYLEWLKKPQYIIIPFNEWVERNLKSNKLERER